MLSTPHRNWKALAIEEALAREAQELIVLHRSSNQAQQLQSYSEGVEKAAEGLIYGICGKEVVLHPGPSGVVKSGEWMERQTTLYDAPVKVSGM